MTNTNPRDLIKRLADALHEAAGDIEGWGNYASSYFQEKHDLSGNVARIHAVADEARAYLEETAPVLVKEQRPDRLIVGDIWEFETEVVVKGKRKPQVATLQCVVKGYHPGECAWQLQSLDEQHYVYLWENAPQYEEMAYIGTKKSA